MPFLPDVIRFGQLPLAMTALTGLIGGVVAYWLSGLFAHRRGASRDVSQELVFVTLLGALLGAKLIYVILDPTGYTANPLSLLAFPYGPLAMPAALVVGAGTAGWFLWRRRSDRLTILDDAAIPATLGFAIALCGWKNPGSWAFAPMLGSAAVAALAMGGFMSRPGERAAQTAVLAAAALVVADVARPGLGLFGGISILQVAAAVGGTAAWLWIGMSRNEKSPSAKVEGD